HRNHHCQNPDEMIARKTNSELPRKQQSADRKQRYQGQAETGHRIVHFGYEAKQHDESHRADRRDSEQPARSEFLPPFFGISKKDVSHTAQDKTKQERQQDVHAKTQDPELPA